MRQSPSPLQIPQYLGRFPASQPKTIEQQNQCPPRIGAVQLAPQFSYGNPIALFDTSKYFLSGAVSNGRTYDVSGDGRRFLLVTNPDAGNSTTPTSATMTVVLNWFTELQQRVPTR